MKNYYSPGDVVTLIAPANVASGDCVLVGSIFGVASYDALQNAEVECAVTGVFDLPSEGAISQGAPVFWNASTKKVTATGTAHTMIGVCLVGIGSGATVARIRLGVQTLAPAA
jgi:predicted RecA/RadA family phage recombinase